MKGAGGKANPAKANEILKAKLSGGSGNSARA
jgi:Asp-tRNA(Asn)/Glu-tRNA(Gln) amidotransferase B subunit